jgi:hypothetical protein
MASIGRTGRGIRASLCVTRAAIETQESQLFLKFLAFQGANVDEGASLGRSEGTRTLEEEGRRPPDAIPSDPQQNHRGGSRHR